MTGKGASPPTEYELVIARIEALAQLETELADAAAIFRSDETGRRGAQKALVAVHKLLCATNVPQATYGPLIALAAALEALDQGKALPMVRPSRKGKGHPVTEAEAIPRAVAAAALELRYRELKKGGDENALDNAAAWAAREIRDWAVLKSASNPEDQLKLDQGRIKSWRAELTGKQVKRPSTAIYDFLTAEDRGYTAKQVLEIEPAIWGVQTRKS